MLTVLDELAGECCVRHVSSHARPSFWPWLAEASEQSTIPTDTTVTPRGDALRRATTVGWESPIESG